MKKDSILHGGRRQGDNQHEPDGRTDNQHHRDERRRDRQAHRHPGSQRRLHQKTEHVSYNDHREDERSRFTDNRRLQGIMDQCLSSLGTGDRAHIRDVQECLNEGFRIQAHRRVKTISGGLTVTERLNKQLKVAGMVLKLLSRGEMHCTSLTKAVLKESPTPWKVQSILRWLLDYGYLERLERGLYHITEKGLDFLRTLDPDVP